MGRRPSCRCTSKASWEWKRKPSGFLEAQLQNQIVVPKKREMWHPPPLWGCWKNTGQGICLQTYAQVCGIPKDVLLCVLSKPFPNSHSFHHSQIVKRWQYFLRPERRSLGKAQEGRRHSAVTTSGEGKHLVQKSLFPPTPGTKKKKTTETTWFPLQGNHYHGHW